MQPVSNKNAEHYQWGDACDGWHLVKSENLSVIEERVPAGCQEVRHYHRHAEQFFYVLAGEAIMVFDGIQHTLKANQGIHVPAKVLHQLKNESDQELHILVTSTPPSHGDRVVE